MAPKEIHAILTETLACFLPGLAKDLSAPHVQTKQYKKKQGTKIQNTVNTTTDITKTHTLQNKLKQPQYKIHPNEIVIWVYLVLLKYICSICCSLVGMDNTNCTRCTIYTSKWNDAVSDA